MPLTLTEKRKIWKLATPGPWTANHKFSCHSLIMAGEVELGQTRCLRTSTEETEIVFRAIAQRFADSTHLETLVAALEKIQGAAFSSPQSEDSYDVGFSQGSNDATEWAAKIAREALNSLNDEVKS